MTGSHDQRISALVRDYADSIEKMRATEQRFRLTIETIKDQITRWKHVDEQFSPNGFVRNAQTAADAYTDHLGLAGRREALDRDLVHANLGDLIQD